MKLPLQVIMVHQNMRQREFDRKIDDAEVVTTLDELFAELKADLLDLEDLEAEDPEDFR